MAVNPVGVSLIVIPTTRQSASSAVIRSALVHWSDRRRRGGDEDTRAERSRDALTTEEGVVA